MRSGSASGFPAEKKNRYADVTVVFSDEVVGAAFEWQIVPFDAMHMGGVGGKVLIERSEWQYFHKQ